MCWVLYFGEHALQGKRRERKRKKKRLVRCPRGRDSTSPSVGLFSGPMLDFFFPSVFFHVQRGPMGKMGRGRQSDEVNGRDSSRPHVWEETNELRAWAPMEGECGDGEWGD